MSDHLLDMLMTGKSREEILRETTRDYLQSLSPEVEDAAYRGMIVHWFNPMILRALLRAGKLTCLGRLETRSRVATAEKSYAQLQSLPFVEEYPYQGYNFHELTRKIVLSMLWEQEQEFYRKVSAQAAAYFGKKLSSPQGAPPEEVIEYVYHLLIVDEEAGLQALEQTLESFGSQGQVGACHALVEVTEEHLNAGRLSLEAAPLVRAFRVRVAYYANQYDQVESLARELLSSADEIVPPAIKASTYVFLADSLRLTGRYDDAIKFFEDACDLYTQLGMVENQVNALLGLGDCYFEQDQNDQALTTYLQALQIYVPQLIRLEMEKESETGTEEPGEDLTTETAEGQPIEQSKDSGVEPLEEGVSVTLLLFDPEAWHRLVIEPTSEGELPAGSDGTDQETIIYYGIESGQEDELPEVGQEPGAEAETEVPLIPIDVTILLADVWMRLGSLYRYTDKYATAAACFRLGGQIYEDLDYPYGVQRATQMLFGIGVVEADRELMQTSITYQNYLLDLARQQKNLPAQLEASLALASAYESDLKQTEAREKYQEALSLAEEIQDRVGKATALVGLAHLDMGSLEQHQAEEKLLLAMDLYRQINHLSGQARTHIELGNLDLDRHWPERAAEHFRNSLELYTQLKMPSGQIDALRSLGIVSQDRANFDEAVQYFQQAIDLARKLTIPSLETSCLYNLANLMTERGQFNEARSAYNQALDLARQTGNHDIEANLQISLGYLLLDHLDFDEALECFEQAKANYVLVENLAGQVEALLGVLRVHDESEEFTEAIRVGDEILDLIRQISDQTVRRRVWMLVGLTFSAAGRSEQGVQMLEEVVQLDPEDPVGVGNYGWVLYEAGQYEKSIEYSQRAYELDPRHSFVLRNIGHAWLALGKPDQAEEYYRWAIRELKEGEHFKVTIKVIKKLLQEKPNLPRGEELLSLIQAEQDRLD